MPHLRAKVVRGFGAELSKGRGRLVGRNDLDGCRMAWKTAVDRGRGSKLLGFPTANMEIRGMLGEEV